MREVAGTETSHAKTFGFLHFSISETPFLLILAANYNNHLPFPSIYQIERGKDYVESKYVSPLSCQGETLQD